MEYKPNSITLSSILVNLSRNSPVVIIVERKWLSNLSYVIHGNNYFLEYRNVRLTHLILIASYVAQCDKEIQALVVFPKCCKSLRFLDFNRK